MVYRVPNPYEVDNKNIGIMAITHLPYNDKLTMKEFSSKITIIYENSMGDKQVHESTGDIESNLLEVYELLEELLHMITKGNNA